MLGKHSHLEAEFAEAIQAIVEEKVDPAIIERHYCIRIE
jgi:hypothetical protein